jgi:hypothetical protein
VPIVGTFWSSYVYTGKFDVTGFAIPDDFLEWEHWDCICYQLPTRKPSWTTCCSKDPAGATFGYPAGAGHNKEEHEENDAH